MERRACNPCLEKKKKNDSHSTHKYSSFFMLCDTLRQSINKRLVRKEAVRTGDNGGDDGNGVGNKGVLVH